MKYIIVEDNFCEVPIVFSELQQHGSAVPTNLKVISAGSCSITTKDNEIEVSCWGQSIGLNLKSRGEEDAEIIKKVLWWT